MRFLWGGAEGGGGWNGGGTVRGCRLRTWCAEGRVRMSVEEDGL